MKTVTLAPGLTLIHGDCMEYMAGLADGAVDLAVVDPPYGYKWSKTANGTTSKNRQTGRISDEELLKCNDWDIKPTKHYFDMLKTISNNQLVCGGNHFFDILGNSTSLVIWDKKQKGMHFAEGEVIWSSFPGGVVRIFEYSAAHMATVTISGNRIHPTQKPIALYRWLLQNYARPGDTILDTHLGSGSSAIAAWEMGYSFTGIEIDKDYFDAAVERISKRLLSPYLPGIAGNEGKGQVEQVKLFCD